jgi:predicted ATPase
MKLRKISLENHPILNNLNLDFTTEDGKTVDSIIFAGENGTGKSSILDLLYEFTLMNVNTVKSEEKRVFEVEFSLIELKIMSDSKEYGDRFTNGFLHGIFTITLDFSFVHNWQYAKVSFFDSNNKSVFVYGDVFHRPEIRPILTSIYSGVEINFTPKEIKSVTAKELDEKKSHSFRSNSNLATEITQLLIDIQSLDSQEFSHWAKQNIGSLIDETKIDRRIKRFTKAFDLIFPSKKFIGVENRNNNKEVLFEENGNKMTIDKLSSGEKQIVFRGGFLLKDKEATKGAIILIDEPEISLHPKWQLQILDFYKHIINSDSDVNSQIFISTHSPFIIHNPNRRNDKVIILTKAIDGNISTMGHPEFYTWSNNKIVKEAFNVEYNFGSSKNKLFVEGETDEKYLNKTKEVFNLGSVLNFDVSWIGRINDNGGAEFTGDAALNHAKAFFLANSDLLNSKVILYYDCDTNKPDENYENLLIRRMPKNTMNNKFKIGIENLLTISPSFDYSVFYSEKNKVDEYGAESLIRTLDKTKLCKWVCEESTIGQQFEILKNLREVLLALNKEYK